MIHKRPFSEKGKRTVSHRSLMGGSRPRRACHNVSSYSTGKESKGGGDVKISLTGVGGVFAEPNGSIGGNN